MAHLLRLRPLPEFRDGMFFAFLSITKQLPLFSSPRPAMCSLAHPVSEATNSSVSMVGSVSVNFRSLNVNIYI